MKTLLLISVAVLAVGCCSSDNHGRSASDLAPIHGHYAPQIDPKSFVARVDNPLWPLAPGTHYHFTGTRGKTPQTNDEDVLHRKIRIFGVAYAIVRNTVSEHDRPDESTL